MTADENKIRGNARRNVDGSLRSLTWGEWYDERLAESIPGDIDEKLDMLSIPRWLSFTIMGTFFFGSWALIVYYTYLGIDGAMSTYYMSLDGTDDVQLCFEVPAVVTGSYYADSDGNWNTDTAFTASKSVYRLDFLGTTISTDEYIATMQTFQKSMALLGDRCKIRDLAWNLMAWSTVNYEADNGMSFYTTADLSVIFAGLQVVSFTTYSWQGECIPIDTVNNAPIAGAAGGISSDGKMLTMSYDFSMADGSPRGGIMDPIGTPHFVDDTWGPCPTQWNPVKTWTYDVDEYEYSNYLDMAMDVSVDIRSLFTAVAVNFGIIEETDLTEVKIEAPTMLKFWLKDDALFPPMKYFIDPFNAPMEPIACVPAGSAGYDTETGTTGGTQHIFCTVPVHGNFVYPVIWGKSDKKYSSLSFCQCPKLKDTYANDNTMKTPEEQAICHTPHFQIAVVYDKGDIYEKRRIKKNNLSNQLTWPVFSLAAKYSQWINDSPAFGDAQIMNEVQNVLAQPTGAGKIDVFHNSNGPNKGLCPNNDCGVGVWTIHPKATQMESSYITKENLQLKDLAVNAWTDAHGYTGAKKVACEDTIYTPQIAAWNLIVKSPPVSLVEPFYECSTKFYQALSDSFGNATSTAGVYMFMIVLIMIFISKRVINLYRGPNNRLRHPKVQGIYDAEQQEIQQARLSVAFKKLIEVGGFNQDIKEFQDFLSDWEMRQSDQNFNKNLNEPHKSRTNASSTSSTKISKCLSHSNDLELTELDSEMEDTYLNKP